MPNNPIMVAPVREVRQQHLFVFLMVDFIVPLFYLSFHSISSYFCQLMTIHYLRNTPH